MTISATPLSNFSNEQFGNITLTTALTNSVNTVWAQVAEKLGHGTMGDYMRRFGFGEDPPLDYPDAQMRPSGVFDARTESSSRWAPIRSTSGASGSGRSASTSRRCRWRRSRRPSPTAASAWTRISSTASSTSTGAPSSGSSPSRPSA